MEIQFLSGNRSNLPSIPLPRLLPKLHRLPVLAVLTRPPEKITGVKEKNSSKPADKVRELTRKTVYNDNWFDKLAINHLSKSVQAATGLRNCKTGYESLVQAAMDASQKFSLIQQRELVLQALDTAFPRLILDLANKDSDAPISICKRVFCSFHHLVFRLANWAMRGLTALDHLTNKVRESELNGRKEKNVVHIEKCRFLEETNCVGMCSNLCKVPSQTFIKHSLGMPVNMVPNFDDMSCEMIFGQDPPMPTEDPAFNQPCYKLCKTKQNHRVKCSS